MAGEDSTSVSVSSDFHFSGLTIERFETGVYAGRYADGKGHPMIDGISLKNLSCVNNTGKAMEIYSSNISNWNVVDLKMESSTSGAKGWYQTYGGHIGFQDVYCKAPHRITWRTASGCRCRMYFSTASSKRCMFRMG